jgi:response regulator RpfG family c-di-GMP phosphodiesterase
MPEMDGYALAETIRREEGGRPPRIPIIALTANAMRGESARAEACGMDEYMTKPVKLEALRGMLERWLPKRKAAPTSETAGNGEDDAPGPAVRLSVLKEFVGDDAAVVREFLSEYQRTVSEQAVQLKAAHDLGDMVQIGAVSHKMKSSSRAVGALKLGDLCAELDTASKAGERLRVRELMTEFHSAYTEVEEQLSQLLLSGTEKERT